LRGGYCRGGKAVIYEKENYKPDVEKWFLVIKGIRTEWVNLF
jgi:hypothetical protein